MEDNELTLLEIAALEDAAAGIRMAARIVDTPCNEMNVDHFLEVIYPFFLQSSGYCSLIICIDFTDQFQLNLTVITSFNF